jgi:hypothetical protein
VSGRAVLPQRRPNATRALAHGGQGFTLTVGFDPEGHPREVFADAARHGSDVAHVLADACVVISLALQYGCPPAALPKSLGRVPDFARGAGACLPASVLGVIAEVVAETALEMDALRARGAA